VANLTASDIAKYIQRPGEPLTAAVDRFRNWTKMGIIKPTGARHPGTGHKKQYSGAVLFQAILLQTLIDATGAPAISLKSDLATAAGLLRFSTSPKAITGELLVLSRSLGSRERQMGLYDPKEIPNLVREYPHDRAAVPDEVHVILNWKSILKTHGLSLEDVIHELRSEKPESKRRG
jgi:hypothetical protein